jgi:hypothetical protein
MVRAAVSVIATCDHRSVKEIERYTDKADQQRLARAAISRLPDKN